MTKSEMKCLLANPDSIKVGFYQSLLEAQGLAVQARNMDLTHLSGALPPVQIWPELWVLEKDYERARKFIAQLEEDDSRKAQK